MEELSERQKRILGSIVEMYVSTVNPVGSNSIIGFSRDRISSATIRNEMHELEKLGYVTHPHTSAGRMPTDKGYRYYVDCLLRGVRLNSRDAMKIAQEFEANLSSVESLMERTTKILSTISEQVGMVVFPSFETLVLKKIELTILSRGYLLVVWVTQNGFIQNRVVDMKEEILEAELARICHFLNEELHGMPLSDIEFYLTRKLEEVHDSLHKLYEEARSIIQNSFPREMPGRLRIEGSHYVLEKPEFENWEKSKRFLKMVEERESLLDFIQQSVRPEPGVQVYIGEEHNCEDIRDCSLVTAPYFVRRRVLGSVAVLGPRRMAYNRIISIVGCVADRLSSELEHWSV
ncbi:MAG: heat-inducible transcription repressor HrcA [Omnitrophica bacterium RIFCSPLOWO2_12_FULL_44_17]|uniref:Heat-inducible transcription repressor HrcA n=1 Tax=Candidatus Danuiimicrobium aquiferis TaxID=1801832 RepID=A0A1G1L1Q9_9BACT|nr:MAG: heat-inducible transcription repressor HrcA [Omnitrophica bacterium RIFCSPHIGHO2_02_FULL_45_28]OGW99048.1 MAG: heat-inducible transcription repressor HrcA [Omnitrophica bacterium RIFCSPLOWO2_12_FULL_44_17]OGX04124.1 MAG: heat-inducible transcription repressor HrcA [Omnitrophica bacterium RIFCSPLOWO2_02_FULL_44_11]